MSDWINKAKTEDLNKIQMEKDRQQIHNHRDSIVNYLQKIATENAATANQQLFGGRETCKVEQRPVDDEKYWNDFCVFIDVFPNVSYFYIRFDGRKSCITRLIRTVKDVDGRRSDSTLPPLEIGLEVDGIPYIHQNGKRLSKSEIGEALVAPVVIFHRDGSLVR